MAIFVLLSSTREFQLPARSTRALCHTMCGEIGDTSDGITLHLYVGTEHLAYERLEPAQLDNKQLIFS